MLGGPPFPLLGPGSLFAEATAPFGSLGSFDGSGGTGAVGPTLGLGGLSSTTTGAASSKTRAALRFILSPEVSAHTTRYMHAALEVVMLQSCMPAYLA